MNHGILYNALKAIKPLRALVRSLRSLWQRYRLEAWVLEGAERCSGEPIRVLVVGQVENCNYLARVVFADGSIAVQRQKMWKHHARSLLDVPDCPYGLIFIQTDKTLPEPAQVHDRFVVPTWIAGELDVIRALESPSASTSVKRDVRHIRSSRFQYRTTRDPGAIDRFFADMYLPYIQQTHGGGAFAASLDEFRQEAEKGAELLLVEQDGKAVAGVLLGLNDPERMEALELGVLDADRSLVKAGALAAIYYFSLLHAANRGFRRLFLGGARPFLNDGPLQYKKMWGVQLTGRLRTVPDAWIFRPHPHSAAARSFLLNNPFVFEKDDSFHAAVFVGEHEVLGEEPIARLRKSHSLPGIAGITVLRLASEREPQAALSITPAGACEPTIETVPAV
jgi:hypothetical protein